ncbi:hypothetical protein AcV5_001140 [Taiwanofungus camphoratus]|nr:hypothetical protein AcW2_006239 [Antrodia cinnamomea]KAI0939876.1 hypothetical protein AcV5_001140 [Antrodia cinnamomea]
MGNNNSRSSTLSHTDSISKPKSLLAGADPHGERQSAINRRASARAPSSNHLGVPAPSQHRRSRSALASSRFRDSVPPPPYALAVSESADGSLLAVPKFDEPQHGWASSSTGRRASSHIPTGSLDALDGMPQSKSDFERVEALRRPMRQNSVENALDILKRYNTVIIVDDSGSMEGSRWLEAREALAALADIASKYDADGIDVCFLNSKKVGNNMKSSDLIRRLFDSVRPVGITPIGEKLENLLLYYLDTLEQAKLRFNAGEEKAMREVKPVNYIVITDGAPSQHHKVTFTFGRTDLLAADDPEEVIVTAARRLDAHNFPLSQVRAPTINYVERNGAD